MGFQDLPGFLIGPSRQVFFPSLPSAHMEFWKNLRRPVLFEMLRVCSLVRYSPPAADLVDEVQCQRLFVDLEPSVIRLTMEITSLEATSCS